MSEFQKVCRVNELPEGEGKTVKVHGKLIAVFRHEGEIYAIDDMCPHMGASLAGGHVENGTVTCPWHAWRFRLCDGVWADSPKSPGIGSFETKVEDDEIFVKVPPPPSHIPSEEK